MALRNLSTGELEQGLSLLPEWSVERGAVTRTFTFATFTDAVAFVQRVANAADEYDHHPDIDIRFDRVRIASRTHMTDGITDRDLELARRIQALS